jgi:hypothetical protein
MRPMPKGHPTVPASATVLLEIIPQILASRNALKRADIIARLRQAAPERGFAFSGPGASSATKKALSQLLLAGRIASPRTGWYVLAENPLIASEETAIDASNEPSTSTEPPAPEPSGRKLEIQRAIGEGSESVYVYFHDAYYELAQRDGSKKWECKVGWTVGEPDSRIIGQGALTCFPRCPVIGLVIKTHDGKNLERLLHAALSYAGAKVNGAGAEWFLTSPALIEQWFLQFSEILKTLQE